MEEKVYNSRIVNFGKKYFKKEGKVTYIYNKDTYTNSMEVSVDMDENKILEKYLDKVDQDRREQELRLNSNIDKMEERLSKERIASEERLEKLFTATMDSIKDTNLKIDKINDKIDIKVNEINQKLDNQINSMTEKLDSTNKWVMSTCIATILAVAAIAASVWFK
jgi:DNA anti-recombination protein RmuC